MYPDYPLAALRRPRVVRVAPQVRHEQGAAFDPGSGQVAVVAHYSQSARLSRSVTELLAQLSDNGYTCALVSTSPVTGRLEFPDGVPARVSVFRRPNVGYDFGSWAAFLHAFEPVRGAHRVLLANDSLVGPFDSIAPLLAGFESCGTDIWGVTGSTQDAPHLQSYMLGFSGGVLAEEPLLGFWNNIRVQPTKRRLIVAYEMGLSRLARKQGLTTSAHFPWRSVTTRGQNPSLGWRRLILSGLPFVKRELVLRPPPEVPDVADVPRVVRDTWGQNVYEWV